MDIDTVKEFSKYVSNRDDFAHATGKGNITEVQFIAQLEIVNKNMKSIQSFFDAYLTEEYIDFLLDNYTCEYSDLEALFEDYIDANSFSIDNLMTISKLGLSKYRDNNKDFTDNYRNIKNVHCAFIEYCSDYYEIENNGCCKEWIEKDYYCFFKYKNNPDAYIEDILGLDKYRVIKDGGEWPLYNCPECDEEHLVYDGENKKFICFNCENVWDSDKISFCDDCGQPYFNKGCDEIQKCYNCIQYILEKD